MRLFQTPNGRPMNHLWTTLLASATIAASAGCGGTSDSQPQVMSNTTQTCDGNEDGWYCYTNPELNVAPLDEFFDTDLIHCVGGKSTEVKACTTSCTVKPAGINDVCAAEVSTTCKGNADGWYCYTNPKLNVDPNDEFFDTDLIHCVGSKSTEVKACDYGCTVKTAGMNDVCTPPEAVTTCKGNKDGWYCSTNPELVIGPNDEFYDGDLIHCVGGKSTEVKACTDSCIVKPSGVDDVCGGATCGNSAIEGTEQCDSANLNGHTCATEGFNGGNVSCTGSCTVSTAACCKHACTGNTQCVGTEQQTCKDGNNDGCNEWVTTGTCAPTCTTVIGSNKCFTAWTAVSGSYQIFEICAESMGGDNLRIHVRKDPSGTFGTRPYGLKVFGTGDPECGHTMTYVDPTGGVTVNGIGSNELTMDFTVVWGAGQTAKRYCAYASTVSTDPGYSSSDPQQKVWWYSDDLLINRQCN